MRIGALVLLVAVLCAVIVPVAVADTGSISRDSRGNATYGDHDVLGGPPTPRIYGFGQTAIFVACSLFLVLAALLGVYTFMSARRSPHAR